MASIDDLITSADMDEGWWSYTTRRAGDRDLDPNWLDEMALIDVAVQFGFANDDYVTAASIEKSDWDRTSEDAFRARPVRPGRFSAELAMQARDELHALFCGGEQYEEERKKFSEQFKVGQAGFGAAVTTVLVPVLGQGAPVVGAVVAIFLTVISKIGLRSWCQVQTARKAADAEEAERKPCSDS